MRPAALLAALFAVLLAAPLAASAASSGVGTTQKWGGHETTEVTKGIADLHLNKRKLYYIPDKQCTGNISTKYLPCARPRLLRVRASHARRAPLVLLRDSLRAAEVWRAPPAPRARCRGHVFVTVEAAC